MQRLALSDPSNTFVGPIQALSARFGFVVCLSASIRDSSRKKLGRYAEQALADQVPATGGDGSSLCARRWDQSGDLCPTSEFRRPEPSSLTQGRSSQSHGLRRGRPAPSRVGKAPGTSVHYFSAALRLDLQDCPRGLEPFGILPSFPEHVILVHACACVHEYVDIAMAAPGQTY